MDLIIRKLDVFHALECQFEVFRIVDVNNRIAITLVHVVITFHLIKIVLSKEFGLEGHHLLSLLMERLQDLVKDVEVALNAALGDDARFLQKVVDD